MELGLYVQEKICCLPLGLRGLPGLWGSQGNEGSQGLGSHCFLVTVTDNVTVTIVITITSTNAVPPSMQGLFCV